MADNLLRPDNRGLTSFSSDFSLFGAQPDHLVSFARASPIIPDAIPGTAAAADPSDAAKTVSPSDQLAAVPADDGIGAPTGSAGSPTSAIAAPVLPTQVAPVDQPATAATQAGPTGSSIASPFGQPPVISVLHDAATSNAAGASVLGGTGNVLPPDQGGVAHALAHPVIGLAGEFDSLLPSTLAASNVALATTSALTDALAGQIDGIGTTTGALLDGVGTGIDGVTATTTGLVDEVGHTLDGVAGTATDLVDGTGATLGGLTGAVAGATDSATAALDGVTATTNGVTGTVADTLDHTVDTTTGVVQGATTGATDVADAIAQHATQTVDALGGDTTATVGVAGTAADAAVGGTIDTADATLGTAADLGFDALSLTGTDPQGGIDTLVDLVTTTDLFTVGNAVAAPAAPDASSSIVDDLIGDEAPVAAVLGGDHHDDGGLLGHDPFDLGHG